jgi:hypothetical protein
MGTRCVTYHATILASGDEFDYAAFKGAFAVRDALNRRCFKPQVAACVAILE